MTLFLSFRTHPVGGGNATPTEALELASPDAELSFTHVPFPQLSQRAAGCHVRVKSWMRARIFFPWG